MMVRGGWYSVLCKLDLGAQLSSLLLTLGLVPRKMVEFNPGLSKILSKVFLSKNKYEPVTKYCCAFTSRRRNYNPKFYSRQCIGR